MNTLIGNAPEFKAVLQTIEAIASSAANVLITGETGTGKELVAAAIHEQSPRSEQAYYRLNCAALPEQLIESELFGCTQGAFTGASQNKPGLFTEADGGTVFLDEINSMPLSAQAKLLRLIELGEFMPIGTQTVHKANVRIIAATNANLPELLESGKFRQDLYFRLNVMAVNMPPLRERKGDAVVLAQHFAKVFAQKYSLRTLSFSTKVLDRLEAYPWPGNVRELKNLCEHLTIARIRKVVELHDLPEGHLVEFDQDQVKPVFELPAEGICWHSLEANIIQQALAQTRGNCLETAKRLGISRDTLYYRIKKYGL